MSTKELIAEARGWAGKVGLTHVSGVYISRLADALEASEAAREKTAATFVAAVDLATARTFAAVAERDAALAQAAVLRKALTRSRCGCEGADCTKHGAYVPGEADTALRETAGGEGER